jgi:hypothetical protein
MATLEQVGELVIPRLRKRVDRLVEAVEDDSPDFAEVSALADAVAEIADTIGDIYRELEQKLSGEQHQEARSQSEDDASRQQRAESSPRERSEKNGAEATDDVTKEELLERARDVNVQGRSAMSKDQLAEAVEAEEGKTKEELLERAQEAGIEGRSSMSKKELREALKEAGA